MHPATISPRLRAFVKEVPVERPHLLAFVTEAARQTQPGARVLDAGAGQAPYRELFSHCDYVASDFAESRYEEARRRDIVAPLHDLPVEDGSFDAVVNTQVLEHVPNPQEALGELHRVLKPGGTLWLTAPFVGELHEEPYDFFRYTRHGLAELLGRAHFTEISVEPVGGYFSAMGALAYNCGTSIGVGVERSDLARRILAAAFRAIGLSLPRLDRFDRRGALAIGWQCRAVRPAG